MFRPHIFSMHVAKHKTCVVQHDTIVRLGQHRVDSHGGPPARTVGGMYPSFAVRCHFDQKSFFYKWTRYLVKVTDYGDVAYRWAI